MEEKRPVGVKAIGAIYVIVASLVIIIALMLRDANMLGLSVYAVIFIISGLGLSAFKNWARILTIIISLLLIIFMWFEIKKFSEINLSLLGLVILIPLAIAGLLLTIGILLMISFLIRPRVKEQFK